MPAIVADGSSFYWSGWLACFMGMGCGSFPGHEALRLADLNEWQMGYNACAQGEDKQRISEFRALIKQGRVVVYWEGED